MRKKMLIIALGLFVIAIGIIVYKSASVIMNNNRITKTDESSVTDGIKEESYRHSNSGVFVEYTKDLVNKDYHNNRFKNTYKQYFYDYFTDKFFHKYKNAVDIYPDIGDSFSISNAGSVENDDEAILEISWKVDTGKNYWTRIVYKLMLTDDGKIDDCEIVETYDVDPRTLQRLDRPMTIFEYDIEGYIKVLLRPIYYSNSGGDDDRAVDAREWGNIPKSPECQIINQPQEPTEDCNVHFPYYKLLYNDGRIKYYKVEYSINDKAQFTKIEFIEATEEEFNNTPPLGYGQN